MGKYIFFAWTFLLLSRGLYVQERVTYQIEKAQQTDKGSGSGKPAFIL